MANGDIIQYLVLGGLAFALVTLVLYVMAHQMHAAISRHDLIREARLQRQAYLQSLVARRRDVNADYAGDQEFNVDVMDDDENGDGPAPAALPFDADAPQSKAA